MSGQYLACFVYLFLCNDVNRAGHLIVENVRATVNYSQLTKSGLYTQTAGLGARPGKMSAMEICGSNPESLDPATECYPARYGS